MSEIITVLRNIGQLLQENNRLLRKLVPDEEDQHQIILDPAVKQTLYSTSVSMMDNAGSLLFTKVTLTYLEEEIEKTGNKKSARRLSINLGKDLSEFFREQLSRDVSVEAIEGLILFKKLNKPYATVRVITDLGYCRGSKFYEVVDDIVNKSKGLGVPNDSVFIIVCSLWNSLEKQHVEEMLNIRIRIRDLLAKRDLLIRYLKLYVSGVQSLEAPHEQIYFLGMGEEAHPNLKANELQVSGSSEKSEEEILQEIAQYPWLSSVDELLNKLRILGGEA